MCPANALLSLICILIQFDWILALQMRPTRHTTMIRRNFTNLMSTHILSTMTPGMENSTEISMSTTKAKDEWNYGNKSLTTAKIIFICAFAISATILVFMLICTVVWNWKTKQRPVTRESPQEVMTQPVTPNPEAKN